MGNAYKALSLVSGTWQVYKCLYCIINVLIIIILSKSCGGHKERSVFKEFISSWSDRA